jgi:hypothetical protein
MPGGPHPADLSPARSRVRILTADSSAGQLANRAKKIQTALAGPRSSGPARPGRVCLLQLLQPDRRDSVTKNFRFFSICTRETASTPNLSPGLRPRSVSYQSLGRLRQRAVVREISLPVIHEGPNLILSTPPANL